MAMRLNDFPVLWAYKERGAKMNEDFIDRSIKVLARGTGYSREFLLEEWEHELWDWNVDKTDVDPELFINFIIVALEGDL